MSTGEYGHLASASQQRELELHRRALAGDPEAKRALEARDLLAKADKVTSGLRDRAEKGDQSAMNELRRLAAGTTSVSATASGTSRGGKYTQADLDAAASRARATERSRFQQVFASAGSHGRERGCVNLLTSTRSFSASAIIEELPSLPTDRERDAKAANANSDGVWERAYNATANARSSAKAKQILDAQVKYGSASPREGVERPAQSDNAKKILAAQRGGETPRHESADPWERAYASAGRGR